MDAGHSCQLGQLISKEVLGLVLDYIGRRHQGPGNDLSEPMNHLPDINAEIESTQRLGGLVRSYWRDASFVRTSSDSTPIRSQYIGNDASCFVKMKGRESLISRSLLIT